MGCDVLCFLCTVLIRTWFCLVCHAAGYPLEVHEVLTADGYLLRMERIPQHGSTDVVFMMHGERGGEALPANTFCYIVAQAETLSSLFLPCVVL